MPMHWQPLYHWATYAVVSAAIVVLILAARRIAVSQRNRRWSLLVLRCAVLAGLTMLLLNPIDRRETVLPPRPPSVALLVDCSQSMTLGRNQSRIDRVKRTISQASATLGAESASVQLFRFGRRLAKVPSLAELRATDDSSLLADALERLPPRVAGNMPQAVVLFSDGAVTDDDRLMQLAAAYRELGVPLHAMVPDEDKLRGDVAITELVLPQRVATGDQVIVQAVVQSHGFDGQRVVVSIVPADRPHAAPLATLPITLAAQPVALELPVIADPAVGKLAIHVPLLDGEAVTSNNRIPFQLTQRERKLNVLYMEGTAGREYRWLSDALQEDPDIQCVSMVVNNQYASRPRLQRIDDSYRGFPATRDELFDFDVVICSDIPYGAFTPEQIAWTVELVDRRGGGFAMVGGHTSFGSGGWDRTPWEELIPFDMTGRRDYLAQNFGVQIPPSAHSHPIWSLLDDPAKNLAALESMPRFKGTNLITRVKPAATLLGQTESPLMRVGIMPVFACESFGRGRTFAMSTDTTLDWGRYFESQWGEGDNRYFRKFWRNVVRWLSENSRASQKRLQVHTDQVVYSRGETIHITAEAFDEQLQPTAGYALTAKLFAVDASVDLRSVAESAESFDLQWQGAGVQGRYVGELPATLSLDRDDPSLPMQSVRLSVSAWDGDQEVASELVELQLLHNSSEWLDPQARPETLAEVAEAGGGKLLSDGGELSALLRSFKPPPGEVLVHTLPLWDRPFIWMMFLGTLAIEWTLRRRPAWSRED
jgi:uncharacterized membrane protein